MAELFLQKNWFKKRPHLLQLPNDLPEYDWGCFLICDQVSILFLSQGCAIMFLKFIFYLERQIEAENGHLLVLKMSSNMIWGCHIDVQYGFRNSNFIQGVKW